MTRAGERSTPQAPRALRARALRTAGWGLAGFVVLLVAAVVIVHTGSVRRRVLAFALSRVADPAMDLRAEALEYDLLRLRATVHGLRASAPGHEDRPFFELERVSIDLPWSVITGHLALQRLEMIAPRIYVEVDADGASNFAASETPFFFDRPVPVSEIVVERASLRWTDQRGDVDIDIPSAGLRMRPEESGTGASVGTATLDAPVRFAVGERVVTVDSLAARLEYDGVDLTLTDVEAGSALATLRADGRIGALLAGRDLAIDLSGTVDVEAVASLSGLVAPAAGTVAWSASAQGTASDPRVDLAVEGTDLTWGGLGPGRVAASGRLDRERLVLDSIAADLPGVSLTGEGSALLSTYGVPGSLRGTIGIIDLARALAPMALASRLPFDPDVAIDAEFEVAWTEAALAGIDLQAEARLRPSGAGPLTSMTGGFSAAAARTRVPVAGTARVALAGGQARGRIDATIDGTVAIEMEVDSLVDASDPLGSQFQGRGAATVADVRLASTLVERVAPGTIPDGVAGDRGIAGGSVIAAFDLGGTVAHPEIRTRIEGDDLRLGTVAVATLRGDVLATRERIDARELTMVIDRGGTAMLDGTIDIAARSLDLRLAGSFIDISELVPEMAVSWRPEEPFRPSGGAEFALEVLGTLESPVLAGIIRGRGLHLADDLPVVLEARLTADGRRTTIEDSVLELAGTSARVTGGFRVGIPPANEGSDPPAGPIPGRDILLDLVLEVSSPDVARTASLLLPSLPALGERSSAGAAVSAAITGPATSPYVRVSARADGVSIKGHDIGPIDVLATFADGAAEIDAATTDPAVRVLARGPADDPEMWYVLVSVDAIDRTFAGVPVRAAGPATIELDDGQLSIDGIVLDVDGAAVRLDGSTDDERGIEIAIEDGSLSFAGYPDVESIGVLAHVRDGLLVVERVDATVHGAPLEAAATVPLAMLDEFFPAAAPRPWQPNPAPARLSVRAGPFTEAALADLLDPATAEEVLGRITVVADLEAAAPRVDAIRGEVRLETAEAMLAGVPIRQRVPTRITIADGLLRVEEMRFGGQGSELEINGSVRIDGDHAMDLRALGSVDLRTFNPFFQGARAEGTVDLDLTIAGTTTAPDLRGRVSPSRAELLMPQPRVAVTDVLGSIEFDGGKITSPGITANVNGGEARIGLDIDVTDPSAIDGDVTLTTRTVPLALAGGLRVEVDSSLALLLRPGASPEVAGSVVVPRGAYRGTLSLTRQALAAVRARAIAPREVPSALDDIHADLRLTTGDDIRVDTTWANLDVGLDLRVGGTLESPTLAGRAAIREGGSVFLNSVEYRVRSGAVDFVDPVAIEPEIDVTADTRVGDADITLRISGGVEELRTELSSSDAAHSRTDIVSLLVTGRTAREAGGAQTEVLRDQALGFLTGEYLSSAGRMIGLDSVRLERGSTLDDARFDPVLIPAESDTNSRLTFSKQVTREFEVVFSQDLVSTSNSTWDLSWAPIDNVELRGIVLDDRDRRYELRHDFEFGGRSGNTRAGRTAPFFEVRVAAVRLEGVSAETADRLRRRLRLRAEGRLDFYRWQEDRDRLEETLHRNGFLEARVVTRREAPGADGWLAGRRTTLVYEIDAGPRTVLEFEGFDLPSSVSDRIRDVWSLSVFDEFLRADVEGIARERLLHDGYPGAEVEVSITTSADVKTLRVAVVPGDRYRDVAIETHGNTALDVDQLREHLHAVGLEGRAWLEPDVAARAIEAKYVAAGFLAASVSVAEPVFEGDRATLPVDIDEGPGYRLAGVDLEGVEILGPGPARAALALEAPAPYVPAAVDDAVRRLAAAYRGLGFSEARVTSGLLIDDDTGTARLSVTVHEGPRQVIDAIEVEGLRHTRRSLVDRTLGLRRGDPADLSEIYHARKRLYDTGLFRSVDVEIVEQGEPAAEARRVIVRVRLQERPMFRLRWGVQVADESEPLTSDGGRRYRPGLSADLTHLNVLGRGATIGLSARVNQDYRAGRILLSSPTTFGLPIRSSLFVTRSREDIGGGGFFAFVRDITAVTAEQRLRPWNDWVIAYSYGFESNDTYDPDADPTDPFAVVSDPLHIARMSVGAVWDTRDHLVDPTRGWFHSSSFEMSTEGIGSDFKFNRYLLQHSTYRPLPGGIVSATALRIGTGNGFGFDLIPSERFYAGGRDTVRGYAEDTLGANPDFFGDLHGGNAVLIVNQEVRFPIWRWVRGGAFLDAGNTFRSLGEVSLSRLKVGTGLGLRLSTEFLVFRLDYGLRLGDIGDDSRGRWHFAIGHAF